MTDLCWGWGSKLSIGSAVRHAMGLSKLSPVPTVSALIPPTLAGEVIHQLQARERLHLAKDEANMKSTIHKRRLTTWLKDTNLGLNCVDAVPHPSTPDFRYLTLITHKTLQFVISFF